VRAWNAQLFDLLDERALAPREAAHMVRLILGSRADDLPNVQVSTPTTHTFFAAVRLASGLYSFA
jgi:hypothetical protein